jgi:hypothetical protein
LFGPKIVIFERVLLDLFENICLLFDLAAALLQREHMIMSMAATYGIRETAHLQGKIARHQKAYYC